MKKGVRTYIVTGLLVWVPLGITFVLLKFLVDFLDRVLLLLPPGLRPDNLLGFHIPGLGIVLVLLTVFVTGVLTANLIGRKLVDFWEATLQRIPLVRSVYAAAKTFAEVVLMDNTESFKEVLLIEYPRKGLYSLCFQTSTNLAEVQSRTNEDVICVFVPTTPNPTSGVMILVPRKDVIHLDMQVEEAVKMVVSLGVVVPRWRGKPAVRPDGKVDPTTLPPPEVAKEPPQS